MHTPALPRARELFPVRTDLRTGLLVAIIVGFQFTASITGAHPDHEAADTRSEGLTLAETILVEHPYLLGAGHRAALESWIQSNTGAGPAGAQQARLGEILGSIDSVVPVELAGDEPGSTLLGDPIALPGDRGGILFRISNGDGPLSFKTSRVDLALVEGLVSLPVDDAGTVWVLLTMLNAPDGVSSLFASFDRGGVSRGSMRFQVTAPKPGRLRLTILSDDTGGPTPAMIQLKWLKDGSLRVPSGAIDFSSQFDSQSPGGYRPGGGRRLNLPGVPEDDYWVIPGPLDMMLPPGRWRISVLRGLEHLRETREVEIESGRTADLTLRPKRWVDMAARGWFSGDDHVHARLMNRQDAENLFNWALAEDLHVVNLLEMGDHARTFFQQRAFGPDARVVFGDRALVPGQEDPRISQLGHTIALNIREPVRDTSRYYLHDWFHDRVHELGGLYGYAHVNRKMFAIHRDLTLNAPLGKVDFVELLQFHVLGTELYYDFLDLGCRLTASAGSDVPWGGTIGEVRVYARPDPGVPVGDGWFEAVAKGRTFVTDGPMIEFTVNDALPGDEIRLGAGDTHVKVRARAWGHSDRATPTRLEIVRFGEIVRAATKPEGADGALALEFEMDAGRGCWVAARASAGDGSAAHTTPVYITRPPYNSWNFERVPGLIDQRMRDLEEIVWMVDGARQSGQASPGRAGQGGLAGAWYGDTNMTRPQGIDTLKLPRQAWPIDGERGGAWSAQWRGVLTIPGDAPAQIRLHLISTGPASLSIDGVVCLSMSAAGEVASDVAVRPGSSHEVALTYVNLRPPESHLSLEWSNGGAERRPVPAEWFSYREEDRTAFRFAQGSRVEIDQLANQSEQLLERVARARRYYEELRARWDQEKAARTSGANE